MVRNSLRNSLSVLALLGASAASADTTIHILHINDLHSRIEPVNKYNSTCAPEDDAAGECFGGVARVKAMMDRLRGELAGEKVLVLDAGDQFQGSMMYTAYKGEVEAAFMEMIGFDAMAVGNHEFDDGPDNLSKFLGMVSFPLVSGNLDVSAEPSLAGDLSDTVVIDLDGVKVGIVSALATDTVDTSSPGGNVVFNDEIESIAQDVAALQAEGIGHIVALTHVGLPKDVEIAEAGIDGLDAIVGGHSHTLLSNTAEGAAGPYPLMIGEVPIVQAMAYSRYVGHLALTFDDAGNVISATGDTIPLDASVVPDPEVAAKVAEYAAPLEEIKAQVVGSAAGLIDGERDNCRAQECSMGNLVADAMLDAVADQGVTIAIQNGGGLRASIDGGEVTMGEVLSVLPFQNTLATFEATGAMITDALENGVSQVEEGAGRFPQVAGLKFTWDPSVGPNEGRVTEVLVRDGDDWVPIDPEATYLAVTNDYMRNGGDGYRMFEMAENAYDYGPGLEAIVARYIGSMDGPYEPYTDGRIAKE
ncbi:bifunctional UDP-sugar hydrolase/5'-nucleotidase [Mangrovicoccus sp. HB161399]|uniref:bifunctional metallophosphatase/5'-nucleotidase n=1 Tax=Mangrovicoccus sp. HB161399 TaxID=2720392 RepID=UPI001557FE00|nr:5'-nucleotidase C-terminal domain-containing protein [Mangrovicoccus sp. HB161399]